MHINDMQFRTCARRRIAEAFQIFKLFEPVKQRSLSEASGTLCGGAEKLRKSKNGAAAPTGTCAGLQISLLLVCVSINFVITFKHAVDVFQGLADQKVAAFVAYLAGGDEG